MAAYYIRNNGSDSNNGTSASTPFKTLKKAQSVMVAADTVTQLPDIPDVSGLISEDADNAIEAGTDGLLYVDGS